MSIIFSEKRENLVKPLLKWGVMGSLELFEFSDYKGSYKSFRKLLVRMTEGGILNSFDYPLNGARCSRKFIYLTKAAFSILRAEDERYFDPTIKQHEAVLSNILLGFSRQECIGEAYLHKKENFKNSLLHNDQIDADGVITSKIDGQSFMIAIEAELNRKNSTRIKEKFRHYYLDSHYDAAIYLFSIKKIRDAYFSYHIDFLESNNIEIEDSKLFFSYSEDLDVHNFNPLFSKVKQRDGCDEPLYHFFSKKQNGDSVATPWRLNGDLIETIATPKVENLVSC